MQHLIIALHGYGGNGWDMCRRLRDKLPTDRSIAVFAPDGDEASRLTPTGNAWYPLTSNGETMHRHSAPVADRLSDRVRHLQRTLGVGSAHTGLIAFSQGTTVASAMLAGPEIGRAVLVCGRLPGDGLKGASLVADSLVIGGSADRFARPEVMREDVERVDSASAPSFVVVPGLGHELSTDVLALAVRYVLGEREKSASEPSSPSAERPPGD